MTIDREQMLGVARHEREGLGRTIQSTDPAAWDRPSGSGDWRCRDVVAHLASTEVAAAAVLAGEAPTELEEYLKSEEGANPTLDGFNRFAVERRAQVPFRQVILEWGRAADLFLGRASLVTQGDWDGRRVPWVAGEIPLRYLVQSRIAEWWSHGEDIRAGADLEPRREHWPMYAVNDLAIRALPWALGLAGLSYPGKSVLFELESGGGGTWHRGLGPREVPSEGKRPDATVAGRGYPFALVASRRVPAEEFLADGTLVVAGDEELARAVLQHIRFFG